MLNVQMMVYRGIDTMYAQNHHKKGVHSTSDTSSSNMSISVMTSISEQNESVSLDDDCPDYDAVINKRHAILL